MLCHSTRLAIAFVLLTLAAAPAQPAGIPVSGRMVFRAHGSSEGLEHLSLTTMAQDTAGFLWVGTEGGAYRYDGTRFQLWSLPEGLPSAWVRAFAPVPDGSLWIGTRAGLCWWQGGRIHSLPPKDPLATARIHQIARDDRGRIWVAAQSGLFRNEGGTGGFAPVAGWPEDPAFSLAPTGTGMWVGGFSALRFLPDLGPIQAWSPRTGVPEEPIKALQITGTGDLWLRTPSLLRVLRRGASGPALPARGLPPLAVSFYEESLPSDGEGGLFVPTAKGLLHFPVTGGWRLLGEDRGIPNGWVNQAFVDRSGNLWVANLGLHMLQGNGSWQNFTRMDGLPGDTTWGMLRDRKGLLWVSTSNGLAYLDGPVPKPYPPGAGLVLYALKEAADGSIWGAGEHPFLIRISPDRRRLARIPLPATPGLAVPVALAFDRSGDLWIATSNDGLWQLHEPGGRRSFHRIELPGVGELGQITGLHLDARGRLWVATGRGLACLEQGKWRLFGPEIGLHPSPLWAMAPLQDGGMWVGYLEPLGLTRLDLSQDIPRAVEQLTRREGLASDSVYSLVADPSGTLWVGGPRGVQRIQGPNQHLFTRENGLAGTDCNPFSTWVDLDGGTWFGTTAGLLYHHPEPGSEFSAPPRTLLMSIGLGRRTWDTPTAAALHLGSVPYQDRTLSARFTSLDYQHEDSLRFQARLYGLEEDWVDLGLRREVRYPALPPGPYQIQVRALREDSGPGPVTSAQFVVLPPWWSRWWTWMALIGLALWASRITFQWRIRRLRARNDQLKALVQDRTQALELSNLALATSSTTDPLTGLRNRRYLGDELPAVLSLVLRNHRNRPEGSGMEAYLIFAMLDIDHFKRVNDAWTHEAGDQALKQIADILRREARESDFLIRWGGEEILFVGHTEDLAGAAAVVTRLHQAIREHHFRLGDSVPIPLTCSIGFSLFPFQPDHLENETWEDQVRVADRCLYAVKRSGRDGWLGAMGRPGAPAGLAVAFEATPAHWVEAGLVTLQSNDGRSLVWESSEQA